MLPYTVTVTRKAGLYVAQVPLAPNVFTSAWDPMTLDKKVREAIVAELGLPAGIEGTLALRYEHRDGGGHDRGRLARRKPKRQRSAVSEAVEHPPEEAALDG